MKEVILLFGSESKERLVSVATAQNLARLLPAAHLWFWAPDDTVFAVSASTLFAHQDPFHKDFVPTTPPQFASIESALDSETAHKSLFLLGVHGGRGEDGTVQRWLEERQIPFTGSGSEACRITFDKELAKDLLVPFGIRVPQGITLRGQDSDAFVRFEAFCREHPAAIAKPVADGSSCGLCPILDDEGRKKAWQQIQSDPNVHYLLEAFVKGPELTVGVIQNASGLIALPCTEIRAESGRFFDYQGKYQGTGVREITPAEVSSAVSQACQEVALKAHRAFGCYGYSRTDIIVSDQGPVFLETNTLPGLTKASLVPQQLAAHGISMQTFLDDQMALAQHRPNPMLTRSSAECQP